MTDEQRRSLEELCERYKVTLDVANYEGHFKPSFDLPEGWVQGWVGPIFVGVSPEGEIHS